MAEFINTIDVLGDDAVIDSIIQRTITEFKDNTLETVGKYAFYGCTALETVDMPNATSIGESAFYGSGPLTDVNFPNVTKIENNAFRAAKLTRANFPELPASASSAFYDCKSLTQANFPKLTTVASTMFSGCDKLTEVNIPNATVIEGSAFQYCTALMKLDCPKVTAINGTNVFGTFNSNCMNTLILRSETMCTLANTGSFGTGANANTAIGKGNGYIYVPRALVDSYKAATNWSTYATQFRALEDYTVDGTITGELDETKI